MDLDQLFESEQINCFGSYAMIGNDVYSSVSNCTP